MRERTLVAGGSALAILVSVSTAGCGPGPRTAATDGHVRARSTKALGPTRGAVQPFPTGEPLFPPPPPAPLPHQPAPPSPPIVMPGNSDTKCLADYEEPHL